LLAITPERDRGQEEGRRAKYSCSKSVENSPEKTSTGEQSGQEEAHYIDWYRPPFGIIPCCTGLQLTDFHDSSSAVMEEPIPKPRGAAPKTATL